MIHLKAQREQRGRMIKRERFRVLFCQPIATNILSVEPVVVKMNWASLQLGSQKGKVPIYSRSRMTATKYNEYAIQRQFLQAGTQPKHSKLYDVVNV
jgi:hypothetical protein